MTSPTDEGLHPRNYHAWVTTSDGGTALIRALSAEDKELMREFFFSLSPQSVYFRFFQYKKTLSEKDLEWFTEMDFEDRVGLIAVLQDGHKEIPLAIGRYSKIPTEDGVSRAEVAFTVADAFQGRGLGSLLLDHLAPIARRNGIQEFEADVLCQNEKMLDVFQHSGFTVKRALAGGVLHISFDAGPSTSVMDAHYARECLSTRKSLSRVLAPDSVALVGASEKEASIGRAVFENIQRGAYKGKFYPINPRGGEIFGLQAYKNLLDVQAPIDLVVIAVPAEAVLEVAHQAASLGVGGLVVISAGFAESGEAGKARQEELLNLSRASGMRLIGPNCLGIFNTDPAICLNATFAPHKTPMGSLGFLSQSGALGLAVLDYASSLNLGLSTFVSVGNRADVSSNDMLAWWEDDPQTKVIALYLESFGHAGKFAWLAPRVAKKKPIVAVKSGRTMAGIRAAASHSASLATSDQAVETLFEDAGVIRTSTLEELFDVTSLFATQPIPLGKKVALVTNAGGPGILFADACEARGLELPTLEPETVAKLQTFLPAEASLNNPVDMIAAATPEQFERTLELVGQDPGIQSVVAMYIPPMVSRPEEIAAAIARGAGKIPAEKPVLSVFLSSKGAPALLAQGPRGPIPSYSFPENAAASLAAAVRHRNWLNRDHGQPHLLGRLAVTTIRQLIKRCLDDTPQGGWLAPEDVSLLFSAAGIETVKTVQVQPQEAPEAASAMGFPLVMKAVAEGLLHKTEFGAVLLNLSSAEEVAQGVETLTSRLETHGFKLSHVLLQPMIPAGAEFLAGIVHDPVFGPLLVFGAGGILAELTKDTALALTPLSLPKAKALVNKIKTAKLLEGFRGSPVLDEPALLRMLMSLAALAQAAPEIVELDLNPVKVLEKGKGALVLDARVRIAPTQTGWDLAPFSG